jgi:hypothetical protein
MIILSVWEWVLNIFLLSTSAFVFVISMYMLALFVYILADFANWIINKKRL